MKYIFNNEQVKFQKEENDGNVFYLLKNTNQIVLNKTGAVIMNILKDYSSTKEVIEELMNKYPEVDKRILENDLVEIMRLLEIYDVLNMENEDENTNDMILYKISGDLYYKKISDFIISCLNNESIKYVADFSEKYYHPLVLRQSFMNNLEYGVFAERNGQVLGYLSLSVPNTQTSSTVLSINNMFFSVDASKEEIKEYISGMINRVYRIVLSSRKINKIRINFYKDHGTNEKIKEILEELGFASECILKNETLEGDMEFYTFVF